MFIMKLNAEMFDKVKSGKKTYEVRLLDEKRQKIGVGDTIIFKKEPDLIDGVVVKVIDARVFPSFEQMAMTLSLASVGFLIMNTVSYLFIIFHLLLDIKPINRL